MRQKCLNYYPFGAGDKKVVPNLSGTSFMEDNLSMDPGDGVVAVVSG